MGTSHASIARRPGWLNGRVTIRLLYVILGVSGLFQSGCGFARLEGASVNNQRLRKGEPLALEIMRAGEPLEPELSMSLKEGDEIKTPPGVTALIRYGNGSEVTMLPESHIRLDSVWVWIGKVIIHAKGKFKAKTEYVDAGTESTRFIVSVDEGSQSTVTMIEGSVTLTSKDGSWPPTPLRAGHEARSFGRQRPQIVTIPLEQYNETVRFMNEVAASVKGRDAPVLVPRILGLYQEEAQRVLSAAGFRLGTISKTLEGDTPIGTVVRQQPRSGRTLKRDGAVAIWVRAQAVEVPLVTGQRLNDAMDTVRGAGLSVAEDISRTMTGQYPPGVVNAQTPGPGQRVVEGTAVKLTVEAESVVIPDVRGMSLEQADGLLRETGLSVSTTDAGLNPDITVPQVADLSPASGKRVEPGTTVTLRVANPGARVPNLVGRNEREVGQLLKQANLNMGRVARRHHDRIPEYVVIDQSPRAGRVVNPGSAVSLTVSQGPTPLSRVPSLVGLREEEAVKLLRAANLRLGRRILVDSRRRVGEVADQNPKAGVAVQPGSAVDLMISSLQ